MCLKSRFQPICYIAFRYALGILDLVRRRINYKESESTLSLHLSKEMMAKLIVINGSFKPFANISNLNNVSCLILEQEQMITLWPSYISICRLNPLVEGVVVKLKLI